MKVEFVNYEHGGISIELVAETAAEYALLKQAWKTNKMERGNGKTVTPDGASTGFFIEVFR